MIIILEIGRCLEALFYKKMEQEYWELRYTSIEALAYEEDIFFISARAVE